MPTIDLFHNIVSTYQRHGWELKRALLTRETRDEFRADNEMLKEAVVVDSDFDAVWFARPSHENREAWELRLIAEQPYALFEAFEADESEAEREDARTEMENRMREFAVK
jgi:hypothetical protein